MIQLSSAGKRYGHKLLFEDLDWLVTPQERVGLVGANGTGKSTLLKILAGLETPDYGSITSARGITAGYLPQEGLIVGQSPTLANPVRVGHPTAGYLPQERLIVGQDPTLANPARVGHPTGQMWGTDARVGHPTVFDECMSVFSELLGMEEELRSLTARMSELDTASTEYAQVADRHHRLDHEFGARDGYAIEAQVGAVLSGLGFRKDDWTRRTEEYSGGWQMRIALAKLLLQRPNLLLLDEPTNHLDLEARNWLEEYLQAYPHAYVLISHDRYFLDVTVNRIAEIWNKHVYFYSGNYDKFLAQKQQRREQLESAWRNQQAKVDQLQAFINRFRYTATKAKQVQSRIKELERMERIQIPPEEKTIHFTFPQPKPSGRTVAEFSGVGKRYGAKEVLREVSFVIERGDRIALVGVNGAGKSTLIKLLAGSEPVSAGERRLGHNVEPDYFAQDQYKEMDPETRVLDDLSVLAPRSTQTELRSLLGCFLFSEDDVFKRIGVLSGGERNRYALARMLLHPSNFLLLDEPTNHLDLRAKDVLLRALEEFSGTVVFVSHDRYFIDKLATRVFEVADGTVHVFPGNYEDYLWRKQNVAAEGGGESPHLPKPGRCGAPSAPEQGRVESESAAKAKRINPIRLRQMEERRRQLEEEVSRVEAEIAECENALAVFICAEETARLSARLENGRAALEALMAEWEELSLALEANP